MIRRWLDRLADRLMDRAWLRGMRKSEVDALRAVHHIDRRTAQSYERPPASDQWPSREGGRR